jgi:S-formylglutathione hydrolase FrmB
MFGFSASVLIFITSFYSLIISAMTSGFEIKSRTKVYDGTLIRFSHLSSETKTTMTCAVYLPTIAEAVVPEKCKALMYLAGLTCSDENVCQKSGIFKTLSELQVAIDFNKASPTKVIVMSIYNNYLSIIS